MVVLNSLYWDEDNYKPGVRFLGVAFKAKNNFDDVE
jgi:hypothetical protein